MIGIAILIGQNEKARTNAVIRDFMESFDWFICKRVCKSQNVAFCTCMKCDFLAMRMSYSTHSPLRQHNARQKMKRAVTAMTDILDDP